MKWHFRVAKKPKQISDFLIRDQVLNAINFFVLLRARKIMENYGIIGYKIIAH